MYILSPQTANEARKLTRTQYSVLDARHRDPTGVRGWAGACLAFTRSDVGNVISTLVDDFDFSCSLFLLLFWIRAVDLFVGYFVEGL